MTVSDKSRPTDRGSLSPSSDGDSGAPFVVVPRGTPRPADQPVQMRRVVAPVAVAAVVIAIIVALAGSLVSRRIAEQQAVHDVGQLTNVFADTVLQPALTDAMATNSAAAARTLDPLVRRWRLTDSVVRVKVWTPDGRVLYSDDPRLVGKTFPLEDEAKDAFADPRIEADVSDLRRPENRFERNQGKLLEVYRPVWTPSGRPLLFETYFRYDIVSARSHQLWRGFAGVMLSSLAALVVLFIPLVWALLARARRARFQRERLMKRALEASDEERRRIAASLHDGVVQQLAAASFTAAGHAEQAAASGAPELSAELQSVASTVRDSIAGLRSLLVDIYPPSLRTSGLAVALRDLAGTVAASEAALTTQIEVETADALPLAAQEATFRVAQEALRNVVRHSGAGQVVLRLHAVDENWAVLEISDDGDGFDVAAGYGAERTEHFGLQLMADAARAAGAALSFISSAGRGTTLRLEVPRS